GSDGRAGVAALGQQLPGGVEHAPAGLLGLLAAPVRPVRTPGCIPLAAHLIQLTCIQYIEARKEYRMSDPERVFRRLIERGFNRGDLSVADAVTSPEIVEHQD